MDHDKSFTAEKPDVDRIRVLYIINDLYMAGAEIALFKLLSRIDQDRFAPVVLSLRDRGDLGSAVESLKIPVHTLGIRGSIAGPISVHRLFNIVRKLRPDVIHGWMYHGNLAASLSRIFARRASLLWSIHQSLYSFNHEKRLTALVIRVSGVLSRFAERIIYVSETSAGHHEKIGYCERKRIVFPYGFCTSEFAPSLKARQSLRAEVGVADNTILIGLIGRYHAIKDHQNFLRAATLIARKYPETRFILCGKGVDTNNDVLLALIRDLGITRHVHLLGDRRDIQRITAALDVAVSSSYSEGFPNVIGEAMSAGVPCVATDVSDVRRIIGATGKVVSPGSFKALAAALDEMIEIGSGGRSNLGKAARLRIAEKYSLDSVVTQYEALYERMTRNSPVQPEGVWPQFQTAVENRD
jgi:glycosyltransferase involved in cell wall biosynthesis